MYVSARFRAREQALAARADGAMPLRLFSSLTAKERSRRSNRNSAV